MTKDRFDEWFEKSEPGDVIMYLQSDWAERRPHISRRFMEAAYRGEVFLYQRRVRPGVFNYYARRVTQATGQRIKPWRTGG